MGRRSKTPRRAGLLIGTAVLLVSCAASPSGGPEGSSSLPPGATVAPATTRPVDGSDAATVLVGAINRASAARSGAFTGTIQDQGERARVSFVGTRDGSSVDVTKIAAKAGSVRLVSVGGSVFVKADGTFWSSQKVPFIVSIAGDRFIKVPAGVVPILDELTLASFVDRSIKTFPADDLFGTVGEETVAQVSCWVLTTGTGNPADGALYVAKESSDVVRWVGTKEQPGRLDFSRWNRDLGITAPPDDEVFSVG